MRTTAALRRASGLALALLGLAAGPASATKSLCNVPIRMSDGIVLRANVFLPDQPGRYPTVLTATGYNKDATNPTGTSCSGSGALATADTSLTGKGYAVMLLDDRGTGASQGKWDSWGARTQKDYEEALDWIQAQSWSNSRVATTGASYMGITSFLIAEADARRVKQHKRRAVQAIWADVPMADAYRDVTFHGGAVDAGFIPLWLGLTSGLSDLPPSTTASDPAGSLPTYGDHLENNFDFMARKIVETSLGQDAAYDGPFYRLRSPVVHAADLKIPVVITGGWYDIFQRGEPLLYESLTHVEHKMLFMSPHYHTTSGPAAEDPNLKNKWFDRWLKGVRNGVENRPPVNLYPIGGTKWEHFTRWPVPGARYGRLYLGDGNTLSATKPAAGDGDNAQLLPVSSPCSRLSAQWTAGAGAVPPCETDNRTFEATGLTYTTKPFAHDTKITGPIAARIWAELTSKDATLVAVLSDVDSSGASNQITAGFLLASQRKLDTRRSTFIRGQLVRPFHPFTQQSQQAVVPNDPYRYDIEIYPTSVIIPAGHSLRLTINGANTPSTLTPLPDMLNEAGGRIRVLHGGPYPSSVLLPTVSG